MHAHTPAAITRVLWLCVGLITLPLCPADVQAHQGGVMEAAARAQEQVERMLTQVRHACPCMQHCSRPDSKK